MRLPRAAAFSSCVGLCVVSLASRSRTIRKPPSEANIKLAHFEKQILSASDGRNALLTGIGILSTVLGKQPTFLLKSLPQLQTLLKPAFETHCDNPKMVTALRGSPP